MKQSEFGKDDFNYLWVFLIFSLSLQTIHFNYLCFLFKKYMSDKPLILVTNDDGIHAKGLRELVEVIQLFGDVVVISSEVSMSGKSNAITVDQPLRTTPVEKIHGVSTFKSNGTPVDSVKLSFNSLLERAPDYVVSGINHGANSSISIIYSGTMGAAIEGSLHGVPSIGFSCRCRFFESKNYCGEGFSKCSGEWIAAVYLFKCEYSERETKRDKSLPTGTRKMG